MQNPKIATAVVIGVFLLGLVWLSAPKRKPAKPQRDYSKLSVKQLVDKLASPIEPGGELPKEWYDEMDEKYGEWEVASILQDTIHPQVSAAKRELVSRGMKVVPLLQRHRTDKRYAYTYRLNDGVGKTHYEVGGFIGEIIEEIMAPKVHLDGSYGGFKGQPGFSQYHAKVGQQRYYQWATQATREEQELAYLRWYIHEMKPKRYLHINSEEHLAPYIARATQLEQQGVETTGPWPAK